MSQFLNTTGISAELEKLFLNSSRFLFIVSPYLKIVPRLQAILAEQFSKGIDVRIIYGKAELTRDEKTWLAKYPNVGIYYCQDLHAKCIINEKAAIISSMNLYDYSQIHNYEMGILLDAKVDLNLYSPLLDETIRIIKASTIKNAGYIEPVDVSDYNIIYTMSKVELYLKNTFHIPGTNRNDSFYKEISDYALAIESFSKNDFYQTEKTLLRTTKISHACFNKIVEHFSVRLKPKVK